MFYEEIKIKRGHFTNDIALYIYIFEYFFTYDILPILESLQQ